MAAQPFDLSPGRHRWPEGGQPIVFWGKPASYEVVAEDPARLREWEAKMAELVGFEPEQAERAAGGLETVSFCSITAGEPIDCDCDVV
jgi:hypothetical protein